MDSQVTRQLLEAERARLLAVRQGLQLDLPQAGVERAGSAELSSLDQHPADAATDVLEREMALSLLGRVEAELSEVSEALSRVDRGTYGTCEVCESTIPDDRLQVVPATRFCVEHERDEEGWRALATRGPGSAEDFAAHEAAARLDLLPTDDELGDRVAMGPEEGAMRATGAQLMRAELEELERRDREQRAATDEEARHRADVEQGELETDEDRLSRG